MLPAYERVVVPKEFRDLHPPSPRLVERAATRDLMTAECEPSAGEQLSCPRFSTLASEAGLCVSETAEAQSFLDSALGHRRAHLSSAHCWYLSQYIARN